MILKLEFKLKRVDRLPTLLPVLLIKIKLWEGIYGTSNSNVYFSNRKYCGFHNHILPHWERNS